MKYMDDQDVRVGDKVSFGSDEGIVVCSIDPPESSDEEPAEAWAYLKKGVMIKFPGMGLVHFPEADADLQLISRKTR